MTSDGQASEGGEKERSALNPVAPPAAGDRPSSGPDPSSSRPGAIGDLAQALAGAERMELVLRRIAKMSLALGDASGVYVERVDFAAQEVVVIVGDGWGYPPPGTRARYPGSLAETVLETNAPEFVRDLAAAEKDRAISRFLAESCRSCKGLVLPLVSEGDALGALVLMRRPEEPDFDPDHVDDLRTLADLAAVALRRELVLEEAETQRERLEESERRFRLLVDSVQDYAICMLDPEGRVASWHGGAEQIYGYRAETVVGQHLSRFFTPEDRSQGLPDALLAAARREGREESEGWRVRADGTRFWADTSLSAIQAADDRLLGFATVTRDLTLRKRGEDAAVFMAEASRVLATSLDYRETVREVARLAVPGIADWSAVHLTDGEGDLRLVEVAHGESDEPGSVRDLLDAFPPRAETPGGSSSALRRGEAELFRDVSDELPEWVARDEDHLRMLRESGVRSVIVAPMMSHGHLIGAITLAAVRPHRGLDEDDLHVAQRIANQAAVAIENARLFREAERRAGEEKALRRAIQAITASHSVTSVIEEIAVGALEATGADGAYVAQIDSDRDEVFVAAAAGDIGPPADLREPFPGSLTEEVLRTHGSVVIRRLRDSKRTLPQNLVEEHPDAMAVMIPLLNGGEAVGSLTLLRRAYQEPFREDELRRARTFADLAALAFRKVHLLDDSERRREELEEVVESRARLMQGFSHDLKNPLSAADGMAYLLEEGIMAELPEEARDGIGRIRKSIRHALKLMEDLLELARAEAGEVRIEIDVVDLRDVAREMTEQYRAQAEARGQTLHVEQPDVYPTIRSDPSRLRQILGNLVSNAVKYTPPGGRIEVRIEERTGGRTGEWPGREATHWAVVAVSDTGPGIPPEQHEEVFREFARLDPKATEGAGLGLAISRRIATVLDGDLTLDSGNDSGATFTLWLPVGEGRTGAGPAGEGPAGAGPADEGPADEGPAAESSPDEEPNNGMPAEEG